MVQTEINIPNCYGWLFEPMRYKTVHGGRGSLKTWSYARALLLLASLYDASYSEDYAHHIALKFAAEYNLSDYSLIERSLLEPHLILCTRETWVSIETSVYAVIKSQIQMLRLNDFFEINKNDITGRNGSQFLFDGLRKAGREYDIKGTEGVSINWNEEAENLSDESWKYLRPTIRKPFSEIWVSFNTRYEDDPTYVEMVKTPRRNAIVKKINIFDVPRSYIPQTLWDEYEADVARYGKDSQYVKNVWDGEPVGVGAKIWHNYDESVHVRDFSMSEIKERGNCYMAMDPHSKFYPFCVWVAVVPKNENKEEFWKVVYNEWPKYDDLGGYYSDLRKKLYFNGSLKDIARSCYMCDGTSEFGIQIRKRYIDTRFAKGAGGESRVLQTAGVVQEFAKADNGGLVFDLPAEKMIDVQRDVILKSMQYNKLIPISSFNSPDLVVLPHCKNVRQSLSNHRCVEGEEKEDEKYKDPSDALRICFAGMADEKYRDPKQIGKPVFNGAFHLYKNGVGASWMG